jgi:hypothetical protein
MLNGFPEAQASFQYQHLKVWVQEITEHRILTVRVEAGPTRSRRRILKKCSLVRGAFFLFQQHFNA